MILFTPNTFRRLDDGTVVHTGAIEGGQLRDFLIARDEPDGGHSLILADYGEMQGDEQQRHLLLHDGRRLAWNADHEKTMQGFADAIERLKTYREGHGFTGETGDAMNDWVDRSIKRIETYRARYEQGHST